MYIKIINIIIIFIIYINLIKCEDHNKCDEGELKQCRNPTTPCLWSQVCKDVTENSDLNFSNLGLIYISLDKPVTVLSLLVFESQLNLISNSLEVKDSFQTLALNSSVSLNSITNVKINNLNNLATFTVDSSSISITNVKNLGDFITTNSKVSLFGELMFDTHPTFISSNVEINGGDIDTCQFKKGIISESSSGSSFNSSMITFIDSCQLSSTSSLTSITINGPDPILLFGDSSLVITGFYYCNSKHYPCLKIDINSNVLFKINDTINYGGNGINLDIKGISLNQNTALTVGGDVENELQYSLVKISQITSASQTFGKIVLTDESRLYQLYEINDDGSTSDISIEDGTVTEIKKSKIHNLQVHSGGHSKLLVSESSIYNGILNISNTALEIGNNVNIYDSIIDASKSSNITIKSTSFNIVNSAITSEDQIQLINTEVMVLTNSSITIKNKNNLISENSYIQPTGSSNFTVNQYYLNGNSKLEVDHSNQDSNFTMFGHLIANKQSIIGLKQLGKLSPHLIVTGNLTAGGCSLEIVFESGTEDLHAEYTILESDNFINNFNQITVYNGNKLIERDYYELVWRGKLCYLLNDVDLDKDFAKSTINSWTIVTVLIILVSVILLFTFYKFYKNKFKKPTANKYEPLEMTDLEKI